MDALGMMRDLDQIRERDDSRESARTVGIAFGGLAAACVLFAVGVLIGRDGDGARSARREDPLARLDALAGAPSASAGELAFPTQLAAATPSGAASAAPSAEGAALQPAAGAPSSAVPVLLTQTGPGLAPPSVPAAALVANGGAVREGVAAPAQLPIAGPNRARLAGLGPDAMGSGPVAPGSDGAFTLQVSSFRAVGTAQSFATRLRERGYRAFVTTAPPQANGVVWHRVRIGPFASLREANGYRAQFEARERLPTFVVRRDAEQAQRAAL